ncbi:MAG: GAF domain-containing protein [Burkholderiales bacterium]
MATRLPGLARLQEIGAAFYTGTRSRDEARSDVVDVIAGQLKCSRVSLWRFDGTAGALRLLCLASKVSGGELVTSERSLHEAEYREYFDVLVRTGMYVSHDAMHDPHLRPMREHYLLPGNVLSMLDAAFTVNGRAYGMVCCEQTDRLREWRAEEVRDLRAIVAKLALLMAAAGDEVLWASPSRPMAPIRRLP